MIIQKAFLKKLVVAAILSTSAVAGASNTLNLNTWSQDFEKALNENKVSVASKMMNMKSLEQVAIPKCTDCASKETLLKARVAFGKGRYDQAITLYNSIPKGSEFWFEAVEERGWAYFKKNDSENALAQTKTLISPQFGDVVNAEAYFLRSLSQLKICDYQGIFDTTQTFKERQRSRVVEVASIAKNGTNTEILNALKKVNSFPVRANDVAEAMLKAPVLFYKDVQVQKQILRLRISESALNVLNKKAGFDSLKKTASKTHSDSLRNLSSRLKELAEIENKANVKIVQKLNLIEVEAIQRVHTDMKLAEELYSENNFVKTNSDKLVFMDDGRPWIDELDKYEVVAKACPQNIRRKM